MKVYELIELLKQLSPSSDVEVVLGNFNGVEVNWPNKRDDYIRNEIVDLRRVNSSVESHIGVELLCHNADKLSHSRDVNRMRSPKNQ